MKKCPNCHVAFDQSGWLCPACGYAPPQVNGFPLLAPALATAGGNFDPAFYAELAAVEETNFWFRSRNQLIIWALRRHFPGMRRFLEVGCGTGFVLAGVASAFPSTELSGSEIFEAGLSFAAQRVGSANLMQMDARDLPYENEFDVIGAFDVLEHIEADEQVLAEMKRALVNDGGGLILSVPQHPALWSQADDSAQHVRRYRVGELRSKVEQAGFRIELDTSFVSLLLPMMWASRKTKQAPAKNGDESNSEFRLSKSLNSALEAVMDMERLAIRLGVRFPFGGSRLIVARNN
jgi:SAM-dependent methyltransferase